MNKINLSPFHFLTIVFMLLFATAVFADVSENSSNPVTDAAITAYLNTKLGLNSSVISKDVQISTHDHVVKLIGTVPTENEASHLIQIVQETNGVKDVDVSELITEGSHQPLADTVITAKINGLLVREKLFGDTNIPIMTVSVETKNGIVYLNGTVRTEDQKQHATQIASSVKGVHSVVTHLKVQE